MLEVKNLIMLFCHTLKVRCHGDGVAEKSFQGYGFTVSQFLDLLLEIKDQYGEILMSSWIAVFNSIFDEDNYTPIGVDDDAEYAAVVNSFPYVDALLEQSPFPRRFPFSRFVPRVYKEVKEYTYACLKFTEDLHLRWVPGGAVVVSAFSFTVRRRLTIWSGNWRIGF